MKLLLPMLMLVLAFFACKQEADTTESTATESTEAPAATAPNSATGANPNLASNMSWTFLTHQLFHHRVTVISGKVNADEKKGDWIDFSEDGTYAYGNWDTQTYTGTWTYDGETKILHLSPSGNEKKSEWKVMNRDDNLVLVGTATYNDNAYQVQWIRHAQRPDKNAKPVTPEDE